MTHYLIKPEETEAADHAERADARSSGDLSCHLQADLYNLQRVGKDDLRASSLGKTSILVSVHAIIYKQTRLQNVINSTYAAASQNLG